MLQNNKQPLHSDISNQTVLFEFKDRKIFVADWIGYRRSLKSSPNLTNGKSNADILDAYRQILAFEYYKQHLDKYNTAFAEQVADFRDGNLLFEIMQRQVWNRAGADSAGLKKYFESRKGKYLWKPGAEAIIFTSGNLQTSQKLKQEIENNSKIWRKIVDSFWRSGSGRFRKIRIKSTACFLFSSGSRKIDTYTNQ